MQTFFFGYCVYNFTKRNSAILEHAHKLHFSLNRTIFSESAETSTLMSFV